MYRFIRGGSGSGKTNMILTDCITAAMADERSQFLLIVPEQSTTAMEKEIVKRHPHHATDNIDVLSFSRLAHRIFDELNIKNPAVIDDISKAMILRKIGAEKKDELRVWANRFDKPGFVDNLKSMLSELYQYGIKPEDLSVNDKLGSRLNDKLCDLRLIYTEFKKVIADKFVTAEEIPDILAKNIHNSQIIKNSVIYLDGFTGFTPIQYRIIEEFICYAKEVIVSVSIGKDEDNSLFDMSRQMIDKITAIGDKNSISHGKDTVLTTDNFLENHLLRYDGAKSDEHSVRVVWAHDVSEEASFIAGDIERQVKKNGLRYRDIAVVCGDVNAYGSLLKHEFDLAQVPYYMDETIGIADNALVLMIQSALDIIKTNYSYESIAGYLKTGLVSDDESMMDAMDIYMFTCGRRGYRRLRDSWNFIPAHMKDVNREELLTFKDNILDGPEELHELFSEKTADTEKIVSVVISLITKLEAERKLSDMAEKFAADGDAARAREYEKVFEKVTELLSNMATLLSGEKLSCAEFSEIFTAGVEQIKLGMLPSGVDRVTVGDITRSRLEGIKVLYVAGANEGYIPKLLNRGSVITDSEKEKLKQIGYELAPTAKEDLFIQRYYLYRVLTKPSDELIMTFSGTDSKGATLQPSYIVSYLKNTYTDLMIEDAAGINQIYDINAAIRRVSEKLRSMRVNFISEMELTPEEKMSAEEFGNLYAYLIGDAENGKRIRLITAAALFAYTKAKLSKESTDLLYGDNLYGSVSKLETFAQCPYEYFTKYGLKLEEIEPFAFRAVDIGNLAHATLEKIYEVSTKKHVKLSSLSEDERSELIKECMEASMLDDDSSRYKDTARNEYITKRVERVVKRSLWGLMEKLEDDFFPYNVEWMFSTKRNLGDGKVMKLTGKIDRTDINQNNPGEIGVRVIDYKSGSKTWEINDVINGNDLQLTMYMSAVKEMLSRDFRGKEIIPEQMYYYTVQDPIIDKDNMPASKTLEEALKEKMKLAGISSKEQIEKLIPYVEGKAIGIGKQIISGEVGIEPKYKNAGKSTSCEYCKYRAICGFDRKIAGYRIRTDKKYGKDEAWDYITGQVNS